MALNVWIREEDLPKSRKLIGFTDAYFVTSLSQFRVDEAVKHIVKNIDGATFINKNTLYSRFGNVMDVKQLSTGCKLYLNIYTNAKDLFDTIDAGGNVLLEILKLKEGSILVHGLEPVLNDFMVDIDVHFGRKIVHFDSYDRFHQYFIDKKRGSV